MCTKINYSSLFAYDVMGIINNNMQPSDYSKIWCMCPCYKDHTKERVLFS